MAEDDWIADPALRPAIKAMIARDLSFRALVLPRHLRPLLDLATRYPALRDRHRPRRQAAYRRGAHLPLAR